jgi:hypothetical protein
MCSPIVYLYYCYSTFISLYVGFPFFYACSFICASSGSFVPYKDRQKLFWNLKSRHIVPSLRSAQFFLSAPPLTWNPGSAPDNGWRLIRVKCLHHVVYLIMFWSAVFFDLYYHDIIINVITPSRPTCQQGQVKTRTYIRMESLEK